MLKKMSFRTFVAFFLVLLLDIVTSEDIRTCSTDEECKMAQVCINGYCRLKAGLSEPCIHNHECDGLSSLTYCDDRTATCVCKAGYRELRRLCQKEDYCERKEDCPSHNNCVNNQCHPIGKPGLRAGTIAAIVLGTILAVILLTFVGVCCIRRRRARVEIDTTNASCISCCGGG